MKVIVYEQSSGIAAICVPVPWARLVKTADGPQPLESLGCVNAEVFDRMAATTEWAETEDEFVDRIRRKDVPADATNVSIIDREKVPADRTYRNALKADLTWDMDKCRDIQRDRMRTARTALLADLDIEYQRADETGDAKRKKEIAAQKQALRDVTNLPDIAKAITVDDLKAAWPDILK